MGVVILTGFSCTGKSTLVNSLQADAALNHVQFIDTDQMISAAAGGHIYDIFLNNVQGANCQGAMTFIASEELQFLQTFQPQQHCVIAAGPIVPTRSPHFADFVARTNASCVWLSITPAEAVKRLLNRQQNISQNPVVAAHPAFGSWNAPHLMEFDAAQGIYTQRQPQEQLAATTKIIKDFEGVYQHFAGGRAQRHFVELPNRRQVAEAKIRTLALR